MDPENAEIESATDYASTPQGLQQKWTLEIASAKKNVELFHKDGDKVIKEYLGEGGNSNKRLNLFYADVQTKSATLSGEPKVRARRRHADANDEVARISADALERLLNTDVERDSDGFRRALRNARGDWQKPGLGQVRFRYVVEEEEGDACPQCASMPEPMEDCPTCQGTGKQSIVSFEDVETDYVHWKDFLWSPARTWDEVRWVAFRVEMSRDALVERFGDDLGKRIPLNAKGAADDDGKVNDPWKRAELWEIWDKDSETRLFYVEGFSEIIETAPNPLGLPNFFPCPEPLAANLTTSKFIPKSMYFLAEELYEQAHELTRRIRALVKSIKVVGAYAKGNDALKAILDDACENELVCVDSIQSLLGEDGIANAAWFLPIAPMVEAVVQLVQQRQLVRSDIAEVLGLSDIMRGQQAVRATATTDRIKARAFSMRTQTDQDEYARFASDAQRIRAFIISKHFSPATIISRSNVESTIPELQSQDPAEQAKGQMMLQRAVQFLKEDIAAYRIEVDAESLSMTDFDAVQQEAIAFMTATSEFFQRWTPLMQAGGPAVAKFALELYQQFAAQLRGAHRFEGIIDRAVANLEMQASQPKPPPPPDPRVMAEQAKTQATVVKSKADMAKAGLDLQVAQAEHGARMQEIAAETQQAQVENQGEFLRAATGPVMPA